MSIREKYRTSISKLTEKYRQNLINKVNHETAKKEFARMVAKYQENGTILTNEQEATLFAQCIQLQFLKSPSSAIFSNLDDFNVVKKDDVYTVSGYYEAQNSYGGMKRDYFQISVHQKDGSWQYTVTLEMAKKALIIVGVSLAIIILLLIFAIL